MNVDKRKQEAAFIYTIHPSFFVFDLLILDRKSGCSLKQYGENGSSPHTHSKEEI